MPGRDEHLRQAERFEAFLKQITPLPHKEWIVIVSFHIALHYVDAFLATKGHAQIDGHSDRWTKIARYPETRAIEDDYRRLYKEAKEARYDGGEFTPKDLESVEKLYRNVRSFLRKELGLLA
jgi:hypothetical protein